MKTFIKYLEQPQFEAVISFLNSQMILPGKVGGKRKKKKKKTK